MPNQTVTLNTRRPFGVIRGGRATLRELANWLEKVLSGEVQCDNVVLAINDAVALGDLAFAGQAVGALVLSGGAGAVGATIDGTLVTAAFATSDTVTMTAVMAAIRANATVNRKVTAVNRIARMTLASVLVGTTVQVFGITFTAVNGAPTGFGQFDMSGSDTADALSLALAINRHPSLAGRCRAVSNVGAVYVGLLEDRAPTSEELLSLPSAATITINAAFPTVSAFGLLFAMVPGDIGNCCTVVASGTGMTYATANAGKLGGGQGGGTALTLVVP
ncbi:MAG: hypothetical protein Q8K32_11060 [Archangium sp.]|nr:hypothetical protein [Archangium sp.]